jgi:uncharacterized protein DUF3617
MANKIFALTLAISMLGVMPVQFAPMVSPPCALAESFNVKTGAWETTSTGVMSGMGIPPEILEKMPPERRAKFEEAMRARSGQSQTRVRKVCITQKDLDQNNLMREEGERDIDCPTKVVSQSSSKLVLERTCPAPHAYTARISIEAKSTERVVASIDRTVEGSGNVHVDIKGQWLGASCDQIKD